MVPLSHTLCIPLNCCKDTVFKIRINHKTRTFSRHFHDHKMLLWALLSLLTTEMTDFPTLSYTSTNVILTLWYTWSLKKLPLRAELPRIGHYREYPPPSRRRLRSRLLRPRTFNASAPGFEKLSLTIIHLCGLISLTGHLRWPPLILQCGWPYTEGRTVLKKNVLLLKW